MEQPIDHYWKTRLNQVKAALEANNFTVFIADDARAAEQIVLEAVIAEEKPRTMSWGGSMTFTSTGVYNVLKNDDDIEIIDTFAKDLPPEESLERRRQALLVDLFVTGTNAVTEFGQLVNLDMFGNRVGAIAFGPKSVVLLVGRNKIVQDLEEAMVRIKNYTAPVNAMRLDKKTPCAKSARCEECSSPHRICNTWTITEKSFPKGRIKVVLINEDLGL